MPIRSRGAGRRGPAAPATVAEPLVGVFTEALTALGSRGGDRRFRGRHASEPGQRRAGDGAAGVVSSPDSLPHRAQPSTSKRQTVELMHEHNFVTYEEFGRRFFRVRGDRRTCRAAFADIAGDSSEMGPMFQGPGGLAKVSARVQVQQPTARRTLGEAITFAVRIPLVIELTIDLWLDKPRFVVDGEIALRATARAADPLMIVIDIARPRFLDIAVHVTSNSLRGEIVRIIGNVDGEIRRFVAAHVAAEIDSPDSQQAKIIDVAGQIPQRGTRTTSD